MSRSRPAVLTERPTGTDAVSRSAGQERGAASSGFSGGRRPAGHRLIAGLVAAATALVAACGTAGEAGQGSGGRNSPEHLDRPYVVMISIDGARHDYLDRGLTPNLTRLAERGVRADALIPVFPTKTFPNHYSLATGKYAASHGLVDNWFYDPELDENYSMGDRDAVEDGRWYGGEPIWVTAETQGMVSASYFWVGTEAPVRGVQPTHWFKYDDDVSNEARVDQVLEWLSAPAEERPHVIMLYFSDVDTQGHRHGPESPEVNRALREVDAVIGRLLDGIERLPIAEDVHIVVVSDHGMAWADQSGHIYLDDVADLTGVRIAAQGPYATLWVEAEGGSRARDERVHALAAELRAGLEGQRVRVYMREEIPRRFRYGDSPRAGDILVLADPGYLVVGTRSERASRNVGHHGYDPAEPVMHGIFVAAGSRLASGLRIPAFEAVHVYPLVAEILGLRPNPSADGRLEVLAPALRAPAHQGS